MLPVPKRVTTMNNLARTWWWLVHKDLLREFRAPRVWPGMLLLGIVLALIIAMQVDLPQDQQGVLMASLFWLAAVFAGSVALDRSFSGERVAGCWQALLLYPISPGTIFAAKTTVNFLALCCLDCILLPAFVVFSDVSLLARPGPLLVVVVLANLGVAATGTLASALTSGLTQRGNLLVLLLLPLISPVALGAAQATRLLVAGDAQGEWLRWAQLLAVFAALFLTMGTLLFEFVIED